jgi:O-antigen/teichoic acid export membrane protein
MVVESPDSATTQPPRHAVPVNGAPPVAEAGGAHDGGRPPEHGGMERAPASPGQPGGTTDTARFLRGGTLLFASSMAGNVLSVAYTFAMARVLGPAQYAALVAVLSLFSVLSLPAGTIQTVVARFVAIADARDDTRRIRQIVLGLLRPLTPAAIVATLALLAASPLLGRYLQLGETAPLLFFAPLFGLQFLFPVLRGALQGLQRFGALAALTLLDVAFKVFVGIALAWWGFGVAGAVAAMLLGAAAAVVLSWLPLASLLGRPYQAPDAAPNGTDASGTGGTAGSPANGETQQTQRAGLGDVWRYSLPTLLALGGLNSMVTLDAVLVKHYFPESVAGVFAALSVAGRSLFWASGAITLALLPFVANRSSRADGARAGRRTLWYSLAIVAGLSLAGEAIFLVAPDLVVGLLFSTRYAGAAPLLSLYGLGATFLALANVTLYYLLGIGDALVGPLAVGCAALQVILVVLFHADLRQVVLALAAADAILLAAGLWRAARRPGHSNTADRVTPAAVE